MKIGIPRGITKMKKLISLLGAILLLASPVVFGAATDDNEIKITQTGDTLKIYIDQIGFGNKIGGNDGSSGSISAMLITGTTLEFDLDFTGNQNALFGPVVADSSKYTLTFTGDSNKIDWNIGNVGSADASDYLFTVQGDSNIFDIDQGFGLGAERLNADLVLVGSSNVFDLDFESDDVVWNWDITGDSNNVNTLQKDGANEMTVELTGDSADVDINQISGTCVSGAGNSCATPNALITLDITSDNAVIQINQKDAANDS